MTKYFDEWVKQPMSRENVLAAAGYYDYYYEDESTDYNEYYEENYTLLADISYNGHTFDFLTNFIST